MQVLAGTSGFSYDEWRGVFYPEELPAAGMLGFYADRLPTVEINNTFYRMPKLDVIAAWASRVPDDFRFTIKVSRRITHFSKLADVAEPVGYFVKAVSTLGPKLGAVLFQLPPFLPKDAALLGACLDLLPAGLPAAVEFRHESWYADDVYEVLRAHDAAMCVGDAEKGDRSPPLVPTASWGYLRLRAADYDQAGIASWAERISAQPWSHALAFFKHEVKGPALAESLLERLGDSAVRPALKKAEPRNAELAMQAEPSGPGLVQTRPAATPRARRSKR